MGGLRCRIACYKQGMKLPHVAGALAALTLPCLAQFPSTPLADLVVAGEAYEEAQPKIASLANGGFYVSWYANDPSGSPAGGYDVRLMRFLPDGQPAWLGSKLIADRGFSSTQDYDLAVDPFDNALLTFRDDRFGGTQITATMVTFGGFEMWGPNGVQLTSTSEFVAAPKITATSDSHVMVGWTQGASLRMQRLDLTGAKTWASDLVLTPPTGSYSISDLEGADNGSAIFAFVAQAGGFTSPRHLYANKVSSAQAPLWSPSHVKVFDGGSLQFGNFPGFVGDGAGGACFAWYSSEPALEVWAQRIDAAGNEVFPHNGVSASTDASQVRVGPALAFDPTEQELFVAYTELNATQSQSGLSAQKFDAAGNRAWGPTGVAPVPVGLTQVGDVGAASMHVGDVEGLAISYTSSAGFNQDELFCFRLDDDGVGLSPAPNPLSQVSAGKYRNTTLATATGSLIAVWQDNASGSEDVVAQSLIPKGVLGGVAELTPLLGTGVNPVVLSAPTPPRIGATWAVQVDKSPDPSAFFTALLIYTQPSAPLLLPEGELLVDITSPRIAMNIASSPTGTNTHFFSIPVMIDWVGIPVAAQAALFAGTGGTLLTNGLVGQVGL